LHDFVSVAGVHSKVCVRSMVAEADMDLSLAFESWGNGCHFFPSHSNDGKAESGVALRSHEGTVSALKVDRHVVIAPVPLE
jgi:hypothetical protein